MIDDVAMIKKSLRAECVRIRDSMTFKEQRQAGEAICQHIECWDSFQTANNILTYLPMRNEVDLTGLFNSSPQKKWLVPRIRPKGMMAFHLYDSSKLDRHPFGMLEPSLDCPEITSQEIELVFVPGLAFDEMGWRLGYGGGFYDRFLSNYSGISAGITYRVLRMEEVPHDSYDVVVDFVITETGIESYSMQP